MMFLLCERSLVLCDHVTGVVSVVAGQSFVRVTGSPVLVQNDPEGRPIQGCPNVAPGLVPCLQTLPVERGYSSFVRIAGRPLCLDNLKGLTTGVPPGTFSYTVKNAGQALVRSRA